jgi:hypothetical protein
MQCREKGKRAHRAGKRESGQREFSSRGETKAGDDGALSPDAMWKFEWQRNARNGVNAH